MERITIHNLGQNNLAGYSELILKRFGDVTKASKSYTVGASKVSPAVYLYDDETPCYYLVQLGGGLLAGEYYENHIRFEEGARAILTTQAPSKVYKNKKNEASKQYTKIELEKDSILEYINDSIILYKDAIYEQKTDIYLKAGATLVYVDGITAGWSPDGKFFQYTSAKMRTKVYLEDSLIYSDNLRIVPSEYEVQDFGILEGYKNFGTLLVIDSRINREILKELRELVEAEKLDIKFGISQLETSGFIMRVLGNLTQDIQKASEVVYNYIRKVLLNSEDLDLRKL